MRKALVVDDEIEICLLVTQHLRRAGYEASFSLSISEALAKISSGFFDLLFVDLNLTDGSGYDLIKFVQESESTSKIIVISAYDGESQKALQKGANLFLAKPFTKKSLDESLQKLNSLTN